MDVHHAAGSGFSNRGDDSVVHVIVHHAEVWNRMWYVAHVEVASVGRSSDLCRVLTQSVCGRGEVDERANAVVDQQFGLLGGSVRILVTRVFTGEDGARLDPPRVN